MKYQLRSKRLNLIDNGVTYKFLQLTPELLSYVEDETISDKKLTLKATDGDKSDVVLCTDAHTFVIKQKMHSNCVLLLENQGEDPDSANDEPKQVYHAYTTQDFELEPRKISGKIHVEKLPIYDGRRVLKTQNTIDIGLNQFIQESPCSVKEFYEQWYRLNGSVVDGLAVTLSEKFMTKTLHVLLLCTVAEELDTTNLSLEDCISAMSKHLDDDGEPAGDSSTGTITRPLPELITSILMKYSESDKNTTTSTPDQKSSFKLDLSKVAQCYGVESLQKFCANFSYLDIDDFMIKWKSSFPPFFSCDIDLDMLLGYYCTDLTSNRISYIELDQLPMDPKMRFNRLFQIQKNWLQKEIWPFVQDLNHQNLKPDNFIIKYARRKRVKKDKFIITSR